MTEHIKIRIDNEEIEAQVTNRKPTEGRRPFRRGDYVIVSGRQMRIVTEIVNGRIKTRNPITRNYDGNGWEPYLIRHATQEEIDLFSYYSPEEMKLRDEIAQELIRRGSCSDNIYKNADIIMRRRRKLH